MSHCDRILEALRDGQWHTSHDLYIKVGHCVLHSRISDLRKKGYTVEGRSVPGYSGALGYEYRLVSPVRRPVDCSPAVPAVEEQLVLAVAPQHYDI
jgi:hypothetical protein